MSKEGVKLYNEGSKYFISIKKTAEEDAGKYTCIAIEGSQSFKADIDVSSK